MSKFFVMEGVYSDKQAIIEACKALGFKPEIAPPGGSLLVDYRGSTSQDIRAEVIIRRNQLRSASNDIGFVKDKDGNYRLIMSDYDTGAVRPTDPFTKERVAFSTAFHRTYSVMKAKKSMSAFGFNLDTSSVKKLMTGKGISVKLKRY